MEVKAAASDRAWAETLFESIIQLIVSDCEEPMSHRRTMPQHLVHVVDKQIVEFCRISNSGMELLYCLTQSMVISPGAAQG